MMAPLMLRNKMSGLMLTCVSLPVPNSVILGSHCGMTQKNSTTEMLKKTTVLGMRRISLCYCGIREQKGASSFPREHVYPHGKLAFRCCFFSKVLFFLC